MDRVENDQRAECRHEEQVDRAPHEHAGEEGQRLDDEQHGRRHQQDPEREADDVRARRAAHCEELGIAREQVEQWLCEREGGKDEQVSARVRKCQNPPSPSFRGPMPNGDVVRVAGIVAAFSRLPPRRVRTVVDRAGGVSALTRMCGEFAPTSPQAAEACGLARRTAFADIWRS